MFKSYSNFITKVVDIATISKCNSSITQSSMFSVLAGHSQVPNSSFQSLESKITIVPSRGKKGVAHLPLEKHRVLNFDRDNAERTSCEAVPLRFFRLRWGAWIRTMRGRDHKLYKRKSNEMRILRQHVFCNAQQSRLLDKLAGRWYMKPHFYVDDPYEPYHNREEFLFSRRKPVPPSEVCYRKLQEK